MRVALAQAGSWPSLFSLDAFRFKKAAQSNNRPSSFLPPENQLGKSRTGDFPRLFFVCQSIAYNN
jgi:hypothetical protein